MTVVFVTLLESGSTEQDEARTAIVIHSNSLNYFLLHSAPFL